MCCGEKGGGKGGVRKEYIYIYLFIFSQPFPLLTPLLSYADGAHYDAHYDYFPPETYGAQASQRLATVLVYLTDVEAGGETCFPLEGADGLARRAAPGFSFKDCAGLVVGPPRAGDALLFYSQHANGTLDPQSLHGGCPVERGVKVVATKWLRDRPTQF